MTRQQHRAGAAVHTRSLGILLAWLLVLPMLVAVPPVSAQTGHYQLEFGGPKDASELRLAKGKSQIIHSRRSLQQVVIGDPEIADIKLLSSTKVLILGKTPGHTNLVFRGKDGDQIAVIDVVIGYDLDGIKRKIYEILPQETLIEVRGANDKVTLSGEVSSLLAMDQALAIARSYVNRGRGKDDNVINLMQVGGGQQVMLEATISEISRNSLRELGMQFDFQQVSGAGDTWGVITGQPLATPFLGATYAEAGYNALVPDGIKATLQALETKGLAKTLAEPNIVALSGQEASFLAGGEIPIPVAQSSSLGVPVITVDYKEFGVGLKFTPTVLAAGKINLKLSSEVSSIDSANSVATGAGISIPAITTRRAGTTIEVADGQSFAIAGLLQSDMNNAVNEVPGLGDIPVLGALFRSTRFKRNETELVIVVTPRIVRGAGAAQLRFPTDNFVPPSAFRQYLLGQMEGPYLVKQQPKVAPTGNAQPAPAPEGVEGSFGHQM